MFDLWLNPVSDAITASALNQERNVASVLHHKEEYNADHQQLTAIIGCDTKWANKVRLHLYRFAYSFRQSSVTDLGNLRDHDPDSITALLDKLASDDITTIFVGANEHMLQMISRHAKNSSSVFVRESIPPGVGHVARLMGSACFMGVQSHLLDDVSIAEAEKADVTWKRLSSVRDALDETEPEIRDAQFLNFDASAIRYSDHPAQISRSTSGLHSEEACRIMRYAGAAPGIQTVALTGHDPLSPEQSPSANTTAQLIWYFLHGADKRVREHPKQSSNFTQYIVHMQSYDFELKFYKSNISGRWWLGVPGEDGLEIHSCAYGDYLAACESVVTDRITRCVEMSLQQVK